MAKLNEALFKALFETTEPFLFVNSGARAAFLAAHNPPLAEENPSTVDPNNADAIAFRLTAYGRNYYTEYFGNKTMTEVTTKPVYEVAGGIELPPIKRGGGFGGQPAKYPFDALEVGQHFFVPVTDKMPDPAKSLAGAVSAARHRYAHETGEMKTIQRKLRNGRSILKNEDGTPKTVEAEVPVLAFTRDFVTRSVEAGVTYGNWTAPANGAIVARTK